jgi:hypothetical protein
MYTRASNCFPTAVEHKPAKLFLCLIYLLATWQENRSMAEGIEAEL